MSSAKAGDSFYLRANYDLTKFGGMKTDDGQLDEVRHAQITVRRERLTQSR